MMRSLRNHIEHILAVMQTLGEPHVKIAQPRDRFLRSLNRTHIVLLGDQVHNRFHIPDLDSAKRVVEQQIEIELKRAGALVRFEAQRLNLAEPVLYLTAEMPTQFFGKAERDKFDEVPVKRV